jgi:hypothetical protein
LPNNNEDSEKTEDLQMQKKFDPRRLVNRSVSVSNNEMIPLNCIRVEWETKNSERSGETRESDTSKIGNNTDFHPDITYLTRRRLGVRNVRRITQGEKRKYPQAGIDRIFTIWTGE